MDIGYLFTSTAGRIPRRDWWIGIVILAAIGIVLGFIVGFVFRGSSMGLILMLILQLILAYPYYALSAKRFQDRGKPGNLALIGIALGLLKAFTDVLGWTGNPYNMGALDWILTIPLVIVGIWYLIELGFLRGTIGANEYGPDPLEAPRRM